MSSQLARRMLRRLPTPGWLMYSLADAKGGIPIYLQALKLTPSNATLREDLGVAYLQQAGSGPRIGNSSGPAC